MLILRSILKPIKDTLFLSKIILLLLLSQSWELQGQSYFSEQYTTRDGLNSNNVYDLTFDKHGRLIILTDHGLNILSGTKLSKIRGPNSNRSFLKGNCISDSIFLTAYNGKFYSLVSGNNRITLNPLSQILEKFNRNASNSLLQTIKGDLIYSNFFEINKIRNDTLINLVKTKGTLEPNLYLLVFTPKNEQTSFALLSETTKHSIDGFNLNWVCIKKDNRFMSGMGINHGLPDFRNTSIDTNQFISCNGQCYQYTKDGLIHLFNLRDESITALRASRDFLWVGTDNGNLYQFSYKNKLLKRITSINSVITSILFDKDYQNLWFSAEGEGITKIDLNVIPVKSNSINIQKQNPYFSDYSYKSHFYYSILHYGKLIDKNGKPLKTKMLKAKGKDRNNRSGLALKFYISTNRNRFIAGFSGYGLIVGKFINKEDFNWYRRAGEHRFLTGVKIDDSTCLLGGNKGLFLFNHNSEKKYNSSTNNETEYLTHIAIEELGESRIPVITKLKNHQILIGTRGKGVYLFSPKTNKVEKVTALHNTSIQDIIEIDHGQIIFGTLNKIYFCELSSKNIIVKNVISLPAILSLSYKHDTLIAFTKKGNFNLNKAIVRSQSKYSITAKNKTISFNWNWDDKAKAINWNCSAIGINQDEDFFEIDLIQGSDTQTFYRSNSNFDFKGFSHGSYDCIIRINPKKGWASNDLALKVNLLPPWYLSATAKFSYFILGIFLMAFIIYVFTKYHQKKYHQQSENVKLELAAIRNVIKPHYLYNTLNTLQAVAYFKDFEKLNKYIAKLSQWLRLSLSDNDHQVISLERELKLITSYLELEKMKFEHGLAYLILNKVPKSQVFNVPFFILQPIIENVLKYSFMDIKLAKLTIDISYSQNTLIFDIMDNGHGNEVENKSSTKKGHSLIERKLALFDILNSSPKKSTYHINYYPGVGTKSTILIFY